MQRVAKGTVAAAGAALLLVGGAGSLAFWNATATVSGPGAIQSGELKLQNQDCGSGWVFDGGEVVADKPYVPGDLIVPGDVLSQTCTFDVLATGEHLRASVSAGGAVASLALAPYLTVGANFTIGGTPGITEITEANNGQELSVDVTVTFNPAADNTTQNLAGALSDFTVTLQQVHN